MLSHPIPIGKDGKTSRVTSTSLVSHESRADGSVQCTVTSHEFLVLLKQASNGLFIRSSSLISPESSKTGASQTLLGVCAFVAAVLR